MKHIILIILLVTLCAPIFGEELSLGGLDGSSWDVYFARPVWQNNHYRPYAYAENAAVIFGRDGFTFTSYDQSIVKSYRYKLYVGMRQIRAFDDQGTLLWVWYYEHPHADIIIMAAWCPTCETEDEDMLTILLRRK